MARKKRLGSHRPNPQLACPEPALQLACPEPALGTDPLIVTDAETDPRFAANPLVIGEPGIRFYAGVPLVTPEGHILGTLCAIDRRQRTLSAQQLEALQALSALVVAQLEQRRRTAERAGAMATLEEAQVAHRQESGLVRLLQRVAIAANEAESIEEAAQTALDEIEFLFVVKTLLRPTWGRA